VAGDVEMGRGHGARSGPELGVRWSIQRELALAERGREAAWHIDDAIPERDLLPRRRAIRGYGRQGTERDAICRGL
jgi:hypothetical protein